ncbi:hydrogenase [Candidatus Beckwithbacteria bacterium CG23_combo_of_CG06-09_8_20_14_all_34_8]|uniref:Hydrogenase n=1 Tax=Candidatus Beckwithbacteria bacterium CG23_combo_of_CG06-09_8_20_14_all_34_8 TaxID=1974497 RepID=A0A2H0B6N2_9BACT|nr:MAG: hydrogenase [Candidatus Beckwithbacteria bacterium CG23_combo_of_CG06-09_8_20_14_all_34_8]
MCLAIPGKVIQINGRKATVKYPTVTNDALISDTDIRVGDWVMVQMGIIISKLSKTDALKALQNWQ